MYVPKTIIIKMAIANDFQKNENKTQPIFRIDNADGQILWHSVADDRDTELTLALCTHTKPLSNAACSLFNACSHSNSEIRRLNDTHRADKRHYEWRSYADITTKDYDRK